MNQSVYRMMHYIQKSLYEGKQPTEEGRFVYTRKELSQGAKLSLSTVDSTKFSLIEFMKKTFDLALWAKYDEYKGENLFVDIKYDRGRLSFRRNIITEKSDLQHLWALPPLEDYFVYDAFDDKHRRRCNCSEKQYDAIPWTWKD